MMDEELLDIMVCPHCRNSLKYTELEKGFGILRCREEYPVISGIPILIRNRRVREITKIIKRDKFGSALLHALEGKRRKGDLFDTLIAAEERYGFPYMRPLSGRQREKTARLLSRNISFFSLIDKLGWGHAGDYLKYRFSAPSFVSSLPLMPMISIKGKLIDLGCGTAHAGFMLSKLLPKKDIICTDKNFTNLLLGKKYFVPKANFVCLDANSILPFKGNSFSTAWCSDSFHYVKNRTLLAEELKRIAGDGIMLFSHLHNALTENPSPGYPLTPKEYRGFFNKFNNKIFTEGELLDSWLKNCLTLAEDRDINKAQSLGMIVSKGEIPDRLENIDDKFLRNIKNLTVNPLYVRKGNNTFAMRKLSDTYRNEYPLIEKYLPERLEISREVLEDIRKKKLTPEARLLLRNRVLLDVPDNYL